MRIPSRSACSTTMRLAIEPTISALPAKVEASASAQPVAGSAGTNGSSSITAGTLPTRLPASATTGTSTEPAASGRSAASSARRPASVHPDSSSPRVTVNSATKSASICQSTSPSIVRVCIRRLVSTTPATAQAVR